jgi:hypothetical protein
LADKFDGSFIGCLDEAAGSGQKLLELVLKVPML